MAFRAIRELEDTISMSWEQTFEIIVTSKRKERMQAYVETLGPEITHVIVLGVEGKSLTRVDSSCVGSELDSYDMEGNFMETGFPEIDYRFAKSISLITFNIKL
ncbi:hypothetical protein L1987_32922 [Smallanthus sonchifolius]|uniref:Uncharacterized protein n=1 Tax=Smallanthus sonchifolius TaxID=185202 RepID=A0ACB9HQA6_9ASTR|nr:hypothetical protein L1987_32922 [Smallanthus sonchifolius]